MSKNQFHTAIIHQPGTVLMERRRVMDPGPSQVRVRLEGCGVCGSNLPVWEGRPWFQYPLEAGSPGHEGWGTIDEVGAEVAGFTVGSRVSLLSYHAFGEVEVADASRVVALPETLAGMDFPGEALGCAMNIFARADVRSGQWVAIVGAGFLGSLLVQLASGAGARVIAFSKRTTSLDCATGMGAEHVISLDDHHSVIGEVSELTGGIFCDRVIEATGRQWPLDIAGELCGERGKLVIAGYHQDGLRQVNMQLWNWRGIDVINAHERDPVKYLDGMRAAIEAIEKGLLKPEALYTHHYSLGRIGEALDALHQRNEGFIKAIVKYD